MRCFEHLNREALASCVSCGKGVCLDCLSKHEGKIYCAGCEPISVSGLQVSYTAAADLGSRIRHQVSSSQLLNTSPVSTTVYTDKNRYLAALLAVILGSFGVHKFYVGQPYWGVMYFLFCWTGIPTLAAWVETVLYLARSDEDFIRRYGRALPTSPQAGALISSQTRSKPVTPKDYERFLLQFAQSHGGQISMAHLMAEAELRLDKVEDALARLSAKGMVQSEIDASGHVRYFVEDFRQLGP